MPSSHLILGRPLLLPPISPSIRVFSNESPLRIRWSKDWSFSFSIIPSKEHPGLISFRMDWLDLLAVQGTLMSFLQHHNSVQFKFSHSVVYDSFQPQGLQLARPPYPSPTPRIYSNSCLLSRRCHPTISSSVIPFSSRLQSFPASGSSNESALHIRWPKYWSFSFSNSPSNEYSGLISFRVLVGSLCSPRDSQESSPTPQFKSINSSVLILLHSPTLTSIHDHRKNHSLD